MLAVVKEKAAPGVTLKEIPIPNPDKDKARIRVIPSAAHSKKDLDFGIRMFEKIGRELKIINE